MDRICVTCAKDSFLKNIIQTNRTSGECSLCGKQADDTINTSEPIFIKTVASLVRYYFSEWDYHTKLGGVNLDRLLNNENPIFNYNSKFSKLDIEGFLLNFIHHLYECNDVHIITAYGRDIYNYKPNKAVY